MMQYDRVHEYLEAHDHTRESYVAAFRDRVRVVKMGCTYTEWCSRDDPHASGRKWNRGMPMPKWDLDNPRLLPIHEEMEREMDRGRMRCQMVACFEVDPAVCWSCLPMDHKRLRTEDAVICVPLVTEYEALKVHAYSPSLYVFGFDTGKVATREYFYGLFGTCQQSHVLLTSALFDDPPVEMLATVDRTACPRKSSNTIYLRCNDTPEVVRRKGGRASLELCHLADVCVHNSRTFRRIPPFAEPGFSDALCRVLAVGRWWHIATRQVQPYTGASTVTNVFGDPFWSLTLCDRLQPMSDTMMNQRLDAMQAAADTRIDAIRAEYTTEITALREALERQQAQHRQAIAQLVRRLDRT